MSFKQIAVNVDPKMHQRLIDKIGKSNFSQWVRDKMAQYVNTRSGNLEDYDAELVQEEINQLKVKLDKINCELRDKESTLDIYKQKAADREKERILEEKEKAENEISCKKCGNEITIDNKSNYPGLCKPCYLGMDGNELLKYQ